MPISFPVALDNFTNPAPADNLNTPAVLHSTQHANGNDAIEALEAKVGADGSAVATSHDYKITQIGLILGPAVNLLTLTNAAAATLALNITAGKTLTLTAADNYTLTIPATGTAALLATANVFTAQQQITVATATTIGLVLKTSDNNITKKLLEFHTSAGTPATWVYSDGQIEQDLRHFHTSGTKNGLYAASIHTVSVSGGGSVFGVNGISTVNVYNGLDASGDHFGLFFTTTMSVNAGTRIVGAFGGMRLRTYGIVNGSLPNAMYGIYLDIWGFNSSASAGTIATMYGIRLASPSASSSSGTITNIYGLAIEDISIGTSLNRAISTGKGLVVLGDKTTVTGWQDVQQLIITGHTTQAVATGLVKFIRNDTTAGVSAMLDLTALGSGAIGDGGSVLLNGKSSTTAAQAMGLIGWQWVDPTHATRKAKLSLSAYDTAVRLGLEIEANGASADLRLLGDTWWEGEGMGLPYGSAWGNEIAWTQASAAQNTWYSIADTDMSDGQLNLVTHDGSGKLTVVKAGRYKIDSSASLESSLPNKHIQIGISVSGSVQNDGINHFDPATANSQFPLGSTAILDLAASATIEIAVRTTDAGTPDISCDHLNISLFQLGGT